jgi:hypothetical protein
LFRFTIRDVLWLTVVAALVTGWWLDRKSLVSKSAAQLRAAEEQQEKSLAQLQAKMELGLQVERIEHEATRRAWEWERVRRAAKLAE